MQRMRLSTRILASKDQHFRLACESQLEVLLEKEERWSGSVTRPMASLCNTALGGVILPGEPLVQRYHFLRPKEALEAIVPLGEATVALYRAPGGHVITVREDDGPYWELAGYSLQGITAAIMGLAGAAPEEVSKKAEQFSKRYPRVNVMRLDYGDENVPVLNVLLDLPEKAMDAFRARHPTQVSRERSFHLTDGKAPVHRYAISPLAKGYVLNLSQEDVRSLASTEHPIPELLSYAALYGTKP